MTQAKLLNAAPTSQGERIVLLDSLRGIAILGILMMNIPGFAMPYIAYSSPTLSNFGGANYYAWYGVEWFLEGSQRAIFSMLFGAGVLLFVSRLEDRSEGLMPAEYFLRRQLWLLAFGLFDAYILLWSGDILFHYAIFGIMLFAFRRWQPKYLLMAAFACLLLQTARENVDLYRDKKTISRGEAIARIDTTKTPLTPFQKDRLGEYEDMKKNTEFTSKKNRMEKALRDVRGPYERLYNFRSNISMRMETEGSFRFMFFDVLLFMFIGMMFYKTGILTGKHPSKTYWWLFLVGLGIGLPISYFRLHPQLVHNFDFFMITKKIPFEFYEISRTLRSLGIFGGIMLLYKSGAFKWFFALMRPVGQMAFTNYIAQSLMCGLFFYGVGFGYYGSLQIYQIYYVVAAVWLIEIVWSHLWLRQFRFGPMEWLWRSLTYWKWQPLRKGNASQPVPQERVAEKLTV